MTGQPISARNLLREAFATMGSIYVPLLIINSPSLIFVAINSLKKLGSVGVGLNTIYWFVAIPLLSGAMIFYTYRSLTGNQVTVGEAFNQANRRLLNLILVYIIFSLLIMAGFIALIIPGFYVSYRLMFSLYAAVIDNSSPMESLSSSWELTKGRWWLVCRSTLLVSFVAFVPILLIATLISSTGNLLVSELVINILAFLIAPLMNVYLVLLYLRLRESAATIK